MPKVSPEKSTMQEIADRLEITVEGESSSGEEQLDVKDEVDSAGSSLSTDEEGDMKEDPAPSTLPVKEDEVKEEEEDMKVVDFIANERIRKQRVCVQDISWCASCNL